MPSYLTFSYMNKLYFMEYLKYPTTTKSKNKIKHFHMN